MAQSEGGRKRWEKIKGAAKAASGAVDKATERFRPDVVGKDLGSRARAAVGRNVSVSLPPGGNLAKARDFAGKVFDTSGKYDPAKLSLPGGKSAAAAVMPKAKPSRGKATPMPKAKPSAKAKSSNGNGGGSPKATLSVKYAPAKGKSGGPVKSARMGGELSQSTLDNMKRMQREK